MLAIKDKESSYEDIADYLGRTVCAVKKKVECISKETGCGGLLRRYWTEEELKKLKRLYPILPVNEVCHILNRSRWAVLQKAQDCKIYQKPPVKRNKDEILALAEQGLSYREIAKKTGGSIKNLRGYAYYHGIKVQPEKRSKDHLWIKDTEIMFVMKKSWREEYLEETDE